MKALSLLLLAAPLAGCASSLPSGSPDRESLAAVLHAPGPHPAFAQPLALYGRFVGAWDIAVTFHLGEGRVRRERGEWIFGWVMEGRAIQDAWIVPGRAARDAARADAGSFGTTIRFPIPGGERWRIVWLNPARGVVELMQARAEGEQIVQEGRDTDGDAFRWIFHDLATDRFRWRSEERLPTGEWRVNQEIEATRRRP